MSPLNVTVTITPNDGSLVAVTEEIVMASRSAADSPDRLTGADWAWATMPACAEAQTTPPASAASTNAITRDRPQPNIDTSNFALRAVLSVQNARATRKFRPARSGHGPLTRHSSEALG